MRHNFKQMTRPNLKYHYQACGQWNLFNNSYNSCYTLWNFTWLRAASNGQTT